MSNFLTKKVGPFPMGVWLAAGAGAVGIGLYLRKTTETKGGVAASEIDPGFSVGEEFPFTFEAPPMQPPSVVINPSIIVPAVPGSSAPPAQPPGGQRPKGSDAKLALYNRWKLFKGKMEPKEFITHYNKNRGTKWTTGSLQRVEALYG